MIRILGYLLCSFFLISSASAQTFEDGFVVKITGDTLRGSIRNDDWIQTPISLIVYQAEGRIQWEIPADSILAFQTSSVRYQRENVRLNNSRFRQDPSQLPEEPTVSYTKPFSLLLRVAVNGKITLLYNQDNKKGEQIFARKGDTIAELFNIEYRVPTQENKIATQAYYRKVLNAMVIDCPKMIEPLQTLPLDMKYLSKFIQAYNACQSGFSDFIEKNRPTLKYVSAFAASGISNLYFRADYRYLSDFYHLLGISNPYNRTAWQAGMRLQFAPPGRQYCWRFLLEAGYASDGVSFDKIYVSPGFLERSYKTEIRIKSSFVGFGGGYYYPTKGNIRPYMNATFAITANRYSKNLLTVTETPVNATPKTTTEAAIAGTRPVSMGGIYSVGIQFKNHLFIEGRWLYVEGPSSLTYLLSNRSVWLGVLGYQF